MQSRARLLRILACSSLVAVATIDLIPNPAGARPLTVVTAVTVTPTSTAVGAQVNWTVGLTATGAMPYGSDDTVTVTLPTGSTFGSFNNYVASTVTDTTTVQNLSNSCTVTSGTTVSCQFNYGNSVNAGDVLAVTLYGVTNPTTTGSGTVSVSTSADTTPVSKSVSTTAAKAVPGVTVTPSTTEAGAQSNWTIGLTTSATGGLAYGAGSTVNVTLPAGSTFGHFNYYGTSTVTDTTTGQQVSAGCTVTSGTTVSCLLNNGPNVNAGDVLSVTLEGITNPTATGSGTVSVSTSSDTTPVSKSVTITAAGSASGVTVTPTSTAVGAQVNWTVGLTATGAMPYGSDDTVTVTLPTGSTFGSFNNYVASTVTDTTTVQNLSNSCTVTSGTTVSCQFNYGNSVNAGDVLAVTLYGVTNPTTTGSGTVSVSTSADTTPVSKSVSTTAAKAVPGVTVTPSTTEAGAQSNWTIGLTTSATGGLAYGAGSTVNVTLPAGSTFGHFNYYGTSTVTDTTTGQQVSAGCTVTSGTTVSCLLNNGPNVNAGDVLSVTLEGITNPTATGSGTVSVSTSSDTTPVSKSVTITAAGSASGVTVTPTSTAVGAQVNWTVGLTATGAMPYGSDDTVTVTLPTGSTFGSFNNYVASTVTDTTTVQNLSNSCTVTSGTTVSCQFNYGNSVNAGDVLAVTLYGVTNPTTTGSGTVSVSTSADTTPVSKSVSTTAAKAVPGVTVTPSTTEAGAQSNWTIGLTTSATGGLAYGAGSTVNVTLPAGSTFGHFNYYGTSTVTDTTTGQQVSAGCTVTSGTTVSCLLNNGPNVNAGDVLSVTLEGITNPTATGSGTVSVSTSSDTTPVSKSVTITAAGSTSGVTVTPTSTAVGAQVNWTVGLTATGAMPYGSDDTVTVTLPTGSTFGSFNNYVASTVTDTTTVQNLSNSCTVTSGTTVSCQFNYGNSVNAGDVLAVTLYGVTNPTTTGSGTVSVSTSADTTPVSKSVSTTAAKAVPGVTVTPSTTEAGAQSNWTIGLTTSATGGLAYGAGSTVNVTLPAGSTFGHFNYYGTSTVTDTTTGQQVSAGCTVTSGTTVSCLLNNGPNVNAGDVLSVTLEGITNPTATGSGTVSVSTSSDTTPVSKSVTITAAGSASGVTVTPTSTAVGAQVNWTVGLTATGAMPYGSDDTVTVTLPTGSTFGSFNNYVASTVTDTTTVQNLSNSCTVTSGTTVSCQFNYGNSVNAGDVLAVTLYGVTNSTTTGSGTVSVSTSADTTPVSKSVSTTAAKAVPGVTVTPSTTEAGAQSNWTIGLTTSATGGLAYGAGSTVNVTLPAGSTFGHFNYYGTSTVTDTTTGQQVSAGCTVTSGTTVSCLLNNGPNVNAGDVLSVTLEGITNPTATGSGTVSVSTSSDTTPVSKSVTITAAVACKKLAGKITSSITFSKCSPSSSTNKSMKGQGSILGSNGTFTWSKSGQTTIVQTKETSPGRGACPAGNTEEDISGSVTGGSSTYTQVGDQVEIRFCVSSTHALKLVKKTKADF